MQDMLQNKTQVETVTVTLSKNIYIPSIKR